MGKRQCSGSADVSALAVGGVLPPTLQEEAESPIVPNRGECRHPQHGTVATDVFTR